MSSSTTARGRRVSSTMSSSAATAPPSAGTTFLQTSSVANVAPTGTFQATAGTQGVWGNTIGISGADLLSVSQGTNNNSGGSTSASQEKTGWNALSDGAKYGIYGGAGAVGLLLIGLITFCCIRKRRRQKEAFVKRTRSLRESFISAPQPAQNNPYQQSPYDEKYDKGESQVGSQVSNYSSYPPQQYNRQQQDYSAYAGNQQRDYRAYAGGNGGTQQAQAAYEQSYQGFQFSR